MTTNYAVINKNTGMLFAGFDNEQQPKWTTDERLARSYNFKSDARGQALLFVSMGVKAQQTPVRL